MMIDFTKQLVGDPTLSEETKQRIANVQALIDESGAKSIHFSWNYEKMQEDQPSAEKVANELCAALEGYFRGDYTEVEPERDKIEPPAEVMDIVNSTELNNER